MNATLKLVTKADDGRLLPELAVHPEHTDPAENRMEAAKPDLKLCNCGGCGKPLLARGGNRQLRNFPEAVKLLFPTDMVAGRVNDRPACETCLTATRRKTGFAPPFGKY